jgi:rod shape determining protein RodA
MTRYLSLKDIDWMLLGLCLLICGLGIMQIYSTTHNTRFAGAHVMQIYWLLISLAGAAVVSLVDYKALLSRWPVFYLATVVLLVVVLLTSRRIYGSKRWIQIGDAQFQVSEFVKLVIILALAQYFSESRQDQVSLADLLKVGLLAGLPAGLILLQPDLGTALTIVPAVAVALFLAGLQWRHAVVLLLLAALALPVVWHLGLKPYQKARLTAFANPEADPQGSGYQVLQSKIAVGSGGLWGKGTAKGSQTQLFYLPVPHTDFILAAFAEEHGFLGVLAVLLLYFMVLMRLIHNAQTAPDRAGVFIIMGVGAVLLFQIAVNVGMVVGYMPVTGIPLPLMSKGGSSLLFTFLAVGLVNNVRLRRFVN